MIPPSTNKFTPDIFPTHASCYGDLTATVSLRLRSI